MNSFKLLFLRVFIKKIHTINELLTIYIYKIKILIEDVKSFPYIQKKSSNPNKANGHAPQND